MSFFANYPLVDYDNKQLRNIMLRANIVKQVFDKYQTYYPYTVRQGERPDTIAYDYYGDSEYFWVVLMSNYTIDPLFGWVLDDPQMRKLLIYKYGSIEQAKTTILHYQYEGIGGEDPNEVARKTWLVSTDSWQYMTAPEKSGWVAVYAYEWEDEQNENLRNIKLLDNRYLPQLESEMSEILLNG